LDADKEALEKDTQRLYQLVDELILPHVDFYYFAKRVLGKHWKNATAAQQNQFVDEFHLLLIRTYATALLSYTGQEIIYKPVQMKSGAKKARVKMVFVPDSGPQVKFSYSMREGDDKNWRVFDIVIEGASLIATYRKSYGNIITQNGMQGLLDLLAQKNSGLVAQ
jgi:phospholipid transport system substrate-binding protein